MDVATFCLTGVTLSACQAGFAWQAWRFQYLHQAWRFQHVRLALRGRRGMFRTCNRCPRKLGDERVPMDAAAFCVTGLTLSACQARFAWQAWHVQYLHRCPWKLDDEVGQIDAAAFCVTGVALSASRAGCVWQAWRLFNRTGRCGGVNLVQKSS